MSSDLTGKKFKELTVLSFIGIRKAGRKFWKCQCSCGRISRVSTSSLKSNKTTFSCKNCGKERADKKKQKTMSGITRHLNSYKAGARIRKMEFNLTFDEFYILSKSNCIYCNSEPSIRKFSTSKHTFLLNGIDRVDNNKGYTKENSVSCCEHCNRAKRMMTLDEYKQFIKKVYTHMYKDNH